MLLDYAAETNGLPWAAAFTAVSRNGMGLIEQAKRWPRLATLIRIADALDTTVENVMKGISGSRTRAKKRR